jgi:L-asparaginase II
LATYYDLTKVFHYPYKRQGLSMGRNTVRKEVVAACMESPFYFTLPLQKRLELMKQVEQQPIFSTLRQAFLGWIKTGILISLE